MLSRTWLHSESNVSANVYKTQIKIKHCRGRKHLTNVDCLNDFQRSGLMQDWANKELTCIKLYVCIKVEYMPLLFFDLQLNLFLVIPLWSRTANDKVLFLLFKKILYSLWRSFRTSRINAGRCTKSSRRNRLWWNFPVWKMCAACIRWHRSYVARRPHISCRIYQQRARTQSISVRRISLANYFANEEKDCRISVLTWELTPLFCELRKTGRF